MVESQKNKLIFTVGNERVFPFNIKFFNKEDISCYINDGTERKLAASEFQVERKEDYSHGANITLLLDPLPKGATLAIIRELKITQSVSFPLNGKFPSSSNEAALDKLTMLCQQLQEENSRTIKTSPTDETTADDLLQSIYVSASGAVEAAGEAASAAQQAQITAKEVEAAGKAAVDAAGEAASEAAESVEEVREALRKSAGLPIGAIFAYPGAVPPEGAYLLNGQTIANCSELYPKFWAWLVENAGQMVATPVYKAWTMPALTADGTLGGAEYAAAASGAVASGYEAYKSFDGTFGGDKTFCGFSSGTTGWLTWYSPVRLKFNQIVFQNSTAGTTNKRPASFVISGSNDNATWTELASGAYTSTANSATQLVEIPESKFNADTPGYQYLRIEAVNAGASTGVNFPEITIYGQEYLYTDYAGNGNILTMSEEAYEYTLARTGVCGGFVVDTVAGSARLPTLINGTLWGADSATVGQSLAAGLPNITGKFDGADEYDGPPEGAFYSSGSVKGADGSGSDRIIHFDASLSSPIYGNSDTVQPPAIRISWCIQVFNAATVLSEQESAQLASQVQMKAQTNLANVDSNIDYVVESWNDGAGGWYRKYRSGWVEQGGIVPDGGNVAVTVNFWVEMRDSLYATNVTPSGNSAGGMTVRASSCFNKTESNMTVFIADVSNEGTSWEVKGKAATE